MSSRPVVRDADRDLTTVRRQVLGSLLGRVWAVDQAGVEERIGRYSGGDSFTID